MLLTSILKVGLLYSLDTSAARSKKQEGESAGLARMESFDRVRNMGLPHR